MVPLCRCLCQQQWSRDLVLLAQQGIRTPPACIRLPSRMATLRPRLPLQQLAERLPTARRIMVVGNGGIALELM